MRGWVVPDGLETLIDTYCAAWNEPDATRRGELLRQVWANGGTYTDPRGHVAGAEAQSELIGRVLATRPGATVLRTSRIDAHHGVARFAWHVVMPDGTTLPEGIDFAEISGGKLVRIVGFFGPLAGS